MNDFINEVAKYRTEDFLREAKQERWLADARAKGYETAGPVARVIKAAFTHLVTTFGI